MTPIDVIDDSSRKLSLNNSFELPVTLVSSYPCVVDFNQITEGFLMALIFKPFNEMKINYLTLRMGTGYAVNF